MKIRHLYFSLIITAFVFMLISGCSNVESPNSPEVTATNNGGSLAKDPAELQQILTYLQQVSNLGFGFGIVDFVTGENAFFFGNFGPGDFLRMNPDGTYSVKLNTNQADAFHIDFTTGGFYTGTGHMNYNFSGTELFFIPEVAVFLIDDPSLRATVIKGHATVTLDGLGGDPHTLHLNYISNPGGQGHFKITFN
jgi:hypothetical protein